MRERHGGVSVNGPPDITCHVRFVLLNAVNLSLVAFNRMRPQNHTGHILTFFVIAAEAAEVAVGLAIVIALYRLKRTVRVDEADLLRN